MFKKLLVPVDLSVRHEKALKVAAELASQSNGEVTLLHVIEVLHGVPVAEDPDFYQRLEKTSRDRLNDMVAQLQLEGISCQFAIRFGERVPDVLRFAADSQSDLIVLSSHPIDPAAPGAGWLSLSYLISIGAPCNVLLIK